MNTKKLTSILGAATIAVSSIATSSLAGGLGVGIGGTGLYLEASGTETVKTSGKTNNKADGLENGAFAPNVYFQYMFGDDGFVIGMDIMPGEAVIGDKVNSTRLDNQTSRGVGTTVTQIAKATAKNHRGIYIETPGLGAAGLFAKVKMSRVDIETEEALATGASYPDFEVDAFTVGLGFKGTSDAGLHMKAVAEYTDYDTLSVTAKADADGVANKIDAELETYGITFSIGYQF
jgi:hypothetical protein